MTTVPPDFLPQNSASPFNNLVGRFYVKLVDESLILGLRVEDKHCNNSGRLHGGMVASIFDTLLGHSIGLSLAKERGEDLSQYASGVPGTPLVTVSLSTDYVGSASRGDWVEATAIVQRAGRSLFFANAELFKAHQRIAKASGIYRLFT